MSFLEQIFKDKRREVALTERGRPLDDLVREAGETPASPDFMRIFRDASPGKFAVIAEIKRRSPSKGPLNPGLDPVQTAKVYEAHGAAAVSVLTDEKYFGGSLDDLRAAAGAISLPVLRKDFIFCPYQVHEARAAGASAVLLIAAMLADEMLGNLVALTASLGLAALVEVHSLDEIERSLAAGAELIGINNRDLHSFEVRLETSFELRPHIPDGVPVIAESGIRSPADIAALSAAGLDGVLIGEALVRSGDPGTLLAKLAGVQ
ncbi:MAG TPA: indole-3-glycerol phosphate synthase TrpC [Anaerolineales bacterium]|nr:indole-3-glycerol phosphate synthase TrpC [Anaerolineales bacterium]